MFVPFALRLPSALTSAPAVGALLLLGVPLASLRAAGPDPTINIYVSAAPNRFGSPSYNAWRTNAFNALLSGASSAGDPTTPSFYQQYGSSPGNTNATGATLNVNQNVVSNFNSYRGVAAPNGPSGNFAAELGLRLAYNFDITAPSGSTFSLSGLSFNAVTRGDDVTNSSGFVLNSLDFAANAGAFTYNGNYIGINYGADGVRGGTDDTFITSGDNTQPVNELIGIGAQTAWDTIDAPDRTGSNQNILNSRLQALNADITDGNPLAVTGSYSIGTGTNSIDISFTQAILVVPEPGSLVASIAGGLGLLVGWRKKIARR